MASDPANPKDAKIVRCQCGCGQPTSTFRGQRMRYVHGHNAGPPLRIRLLSQLVIDPSGCLLWTGPTDKDGYGRVWLGRRMRPVHRVMWEMFEGPIPDGLTLDHVKARGCTHKNCASIAHLEPVPNKVNVMRGETIPAINARKTHCPQGHPYDEVNTYWRNGWRACRACHRATANRARAKRAAA